MSRIMPLLCLAAETDEKVNITPILLRFMGKFFLIFSAASRPLAFIAVHTSINIRSIFCDKQ